jgi:hypothetical protein
MLDKKAITGKEGLADTISPGPSLFSYDIDNSGCKLDAQRFRVIRINTAGPDEGLQDKSVILTGRRRGSARPSKGRRGVNRRWI